MPYLPLGVFVPQGTFSEWKHLMVALLSKHFWCRREYCHERGSRPAAMHYLRATLRSRLAP